jgi:hypothetical protein
LQAKQINRVIPGWNEIVSEHKRKAIFWHNLWKANGSPRNSIIADIRHRMRSQYHLSIRNARKTNKKFTANRLVEDLTTKNKFTANRLVEDLTTKNDKNFWKEIKRLVDRLPSSLIM